MCVSILKLNYQHLSTPPQILHLCRHYSNSSSADKALHYIYLLSLLCIGFFLKVKSNKFSLIILFCIFLYESLYFCVLAMDGLSRQLRNAFLAGVLVVIQIFFSLCFRILCFVAQCYFVKTENNDIFSYFLLFFL